MEKHILKNGVSSIAEAKTNKWGMLNERMLERYYHLAVSRLNEQHSRLSTIKFCREYWPMKETTLGRGIDKRLLNIFPQSGQIPC